jgi:hypothetical protein
MLALLGHMSRSMLERYSHIRMAARVMLLRELRSHRQKDPKFVGSTCESPCI